MCRPFLVVSSQEKLLCNFNAPKVQFIPAGTRIFVSELSHHKTNSHPEGDLWSPFYFFLYGFFVPSVSSYALKPLRLLLCPGRQSKQTALVRHRPSLELSASPLCHRSADCYYKIFTIGNSHNYRAIHESLFSAFPLSGCGLTAIHKLSAHRPLSSAFNLLSLAVYFTRLPSPALFPTGRGRYIVLFREFLRVSL